MTAPTQWDLARLRTLTRDHPWFRTAHADESGPRFDGFALFNYTPWHLARERDDLKYVSSLILDFKKNDTSAVAAVCNLARATLTDLISTGIWKGRRLEGYASDGYEWFGRDLIVAPSSAVGVGNIQTNTLAASLESLFEEDLDPDHPFNHSGYCLERHTAQGPSHLNKKTVDEHLGTIRIVPNATCKPWCGHTLPRYMVLDDVYTRGATFGACKKLLRDQSPTADVMGFFVSVTAY